MDTDEWEIPTQLIFYACDNCGAQVTVIKNISECECIFCKKGEMKIILVKKI